MLLNSARMYNWYCETLNTQKQIASFTTNWLIDDCNRVPVVIFIVRSVVLFSCGVLHLLHEGMALMLWIIYSDDFKRKKGFRISTTEMADTKVHRLTRKIRIRLHHLHQKMRTDIQWIYCSRWWSQLTITSHQTMHLILSVRFNYLSW